MFARLHYTCVLEVYEHIVAKHKSIRFDVQAVSDGFTWRRASSSLEIDEETLEDHRETISSGARALREDAFVKACAMLFLRVDLVFYFRDTRANKAGLGPAPGRQDLSLCTPVRYRERSIRGHLRAAISRLSESTPHAAVVLQEA